METFSDQSRAYLLAFLVHFAVFVMLFFGFFFTQDSKPIVLEGAVIEAELIGKPSAPAAHTVAKPRVEPPKPAPPPEPTPVPPKPAPPVPEEVKQPPPTVQKNDNVDQEKIDELALQKAENAKHAQEEKKRQQQIQLEDEQRKEAEAKAKLQKELEAIRAEREKAAKQTRLAQQKMQQLDNLQKQQSQPPAKPDKPVPPDVPNGDERRTGANGNDSSLAAEYASAIQKVVTDNWNRPDMATGGILCAVKIIQIPGGTVLSAVIASPCNADAVTRTSITNAVTKAQPLPYKGYEKVFQREVTFKFKFDGN